MFWPMIISFLWFFLLSFIPTEVRFLRPFDRSEPVALTLLLLMAFRLTVLKLLFTRRLGVHLASIE